MKQLRAVIKRYKSRKAKDAEFDLRMEFDITERDGFIYLTHNGVAFMKASGDTCADSLSLMLNGARETAIKYAKNGYKSNQADK